MKIPTLCKKVTDPPEETVGAWERTSCEMCGTGLRTTVAARAALKKRDLILFPICFDCAVKGPDGIYRAMYGNDQCGIGQRKIESGESRIVDGVKLTNYGEEPICVDDAAVDDLKQ